MSKSASVHRFPAAAALASALAAAAAADTPLGGSITLNADAPLPEGLSMECVAVGAAVLCSRGAFACTDAATQRRG